MSKIRHTQILSHMHRHTPTHKFDTDRHRQTRTCTQTDKHMDIQTDERMP